MASTDAASAGAAGSLRRPVWPAARAGTSTKETISNRELIIVVLPERFEAIPARLVPEEEMRILSPRIHGVIDLVIVLVFLLAPITIGLGGSPAAIAYSLAAIHLLMTLLTRFPMGVWKRIPFFFHGIVELIVGMALLLLPSYAGYGPGSPAKRFYLAMGAAILVVWALTAYRGAEATAEA